MAEGGKGAKTLGKIDLPCWTTVVVACSRLVASLIGATVLLIPTILSLLA